MSAVSSCTGACCAVFPIPALPHGEFSPPRLSRIRDGSTLGAMLLPVGPDEAAQLAVDSGQRAAWPDGLPMYACRWWDSATRRCSNYALRPEMCSKYPYDSACVHCGGRAVEETAP